MRTSIESNIFGKLHDIEKTIKGFFKVEQVYLQKLFSILKLKKIR